MALRAILALAGPTMLLGGACEPGTEACDAGADDAWSALQASTAPHSRHASFLQRTAAQELARQESAEVHTIFTTDCHPHNMWQSELLFFSAQRVGQRGPVTQILSGCTPERKQHAEQRLASLGLPGQYKMHFVPEFNDRHSHVINKPYSVHAWFRSAGPEADIVAVVDPDFIFVKPLTATLEGAQEAPLGWDDGQQRPTKVQKGVVAAQRWAMTYLSDSAEPWKPNLNSHPANMTDAELFTWICSGSTTGKSGCTGASQKEVSYYHSTGVPYLAHKDDWDEWLVDSWKDITTRLHTVYTGYYVDMWSWMMANIHRGKRELVLTDLMLASPHAGQRNIPFEPWASVEELAADPCKDPMDQILGSPTRANFIHYCQPWPGAWNKYWFDQWHSDGLHVLERCDATAEDPHLSQLIQGSVNRTDRAQTFLQCVVRRMFAGALKRTCAGRPAALAVEAISANFTL